MLQIAVYLPLNLMVRRLHGSFVQQLRELSLFLSGKAIEGLLDGSVLRMSCQVMMHRWVLGVMFGLQLEDVAHQEFYDQSETYHLGSCASNINEI
jgi:hypothetical protein